MVIIPSISIIKKLLIYNMYSFHCEIIPSIIIKYNLLFNIDTQTPIQIYLDTRSNKSFEEYIKQTFPTIIFSNITDYDYYIDCSVYDRDYINLDTTVNSNKKYISHEISDRLQNNPNVFFLTPLSIKNIIYADVLPFSEQKTSTHIPIYIIQGDIRRRNISLLTTILDRTYKYDFIIKLLNRNGTCDSLEKYKTKIVYKTNLDFINYHKEFLNAYCILPLITKQSHPAYYKYKLTSTINYALGYNIKCLIDKDLQDIYKLKNVEIFNNIGDIALAFENTLETFYSKVDSDKT